MHFEDASKEFSIKIYYVFSSIKVFPLLKGSESITPALPLHCLKSFRLQMHKTNQRWSSSLTDREIPLWASAIACSKRSQASTALVAVQKVLFDLDLGFSSDANQRRPDVFFCLLPSAGIRAGPGQGHELRTKSQRSFLSLHLWHIAFCLHVRQPLYQCSIA